MNIFYLIIFYLLLLSPITGVLWRIPVFGFDLLPSDLIIPILFVGWCVDKFRSDRTVRIGRLGKVILLFLFVLLITYLLNLFRFDFREMLIGAAYMCRTGMYIILAPMVFDILQRKKELLPVILRGFYISVMVIVFFGILQLKFYPNFLELGLHLLGWDPHIGRMTSTWLDPNFLGGYLALMIGIMVSVGLYYRHNRQKAMFYLFALLTLIAIVSLYFTFSRSGYLALIASLAVLAFFKSRKLLVATVLICVLGFSFSPRVQERVSEMYTSAGTLVGLDEQRALDPTAELRVWSWSFAQEMITDHPFIGIGYSRYKYEVNSRGHALLTDHAAGGSDSSLLTIWATTGIFGLLSFLAIGFVGLILSFKRMWKNTDYSSYLLAGFVSGFAGLLIHSIFVNSLLFPLVMIYLWVGLGIIDDQVSLSEPL